MTRCASTARPLTIDGRDGGGASPVPSLLSDGGGDDNFASILGSYLPSGRESRDGAALGVRTVVVPPVAGEGGAPVLMVGVEGRDLPASVLSVTARPGPLVVASASSAVERLPLQGRRRHWKRVPAVDLARTRLDSARSVYRHIIAATAVVVVPRGRFGEEESLAYSQSMSVGLGPAP